MFHILSNNQKLTIIDYWKNYNPDTFIIESVKFLKISVDKAFYLYEEVEKLYKMNNETFESIIKEIKVLTTI